ncbi:uncharacterized protein N7459_003282 [Penicillium hispanicum]|uniref:uncharacterized protein n=1 Tax=Penicillium hispanicum TaxID=1080232 RepID=UPI0025418A4C|nr:uncharacterized protein N7459_003282 [Penicillium hispanicum]KAJ5587517.1 hypothetical protein N7459_003282 [Penicillium hispanicum]
MSKNSKLAYDAKEPAFLQKLRGQYGNMSGRLERPVERARKARDPKNDEDDAPVYVDEQSNEVISREEYKALVEGDARKQKEDDASTKDPTTAEGKDKTQPYAESTATKQSNLTEVGGQRKRKQAKVVGEEDKPEAEEAQRKTPVSRKPKKAKKIKLSFDEE